MNNRLSLISTGVVSIGLGICAQAAVAQHQTDFWIGRTSDNTLTMGGLFDPEHPVVTVLPAVGGLLTGWSDNDPGFDHIQSPQPKPDLMPLEVGAEIWIEVVDFTPAFRAIDASFQVLDMPGEQTFLGDQAVHEHLTWHIDSTSRSFDGLRTLWVTRFKIIDMGSTAYGDMEFVTLFRNVACTTGDINDDGEIDASDEEAFDLVLADPAAATAGQRCAADCDLDGLVTAADVPFCEDLFPDAHGHDGDLVVGRTEDHRLDVEYDFDEVAVLPEVDGVIAGWAFDEPGVISLDENEPDEGFFVLDPAASVVLEVVSLDPALKMWLPGLSDALVAPGDRWVIGEPDFDEHATWHIDSANAQFDELRTLWQAHFVLIDEGTASYAPTRALSLKLSNVACDTGDVNGDGQVTSADACVFYDVLADPGAAEAIQRCAADADLDGLVTESDEGPFLALIPEPHIASSSPPDGAIDARQTSDINGGVDQGWNQLTLTLGIGAEFVEADDFTVEHSGKGSAPLIIDIVAVSEETVGITLDRPVTAGAWTWLVHESSCTRVRLGYLPADVNGDGTSGPLDILALIDHLNGIDDLSDWSTDINRSGLTEPSDILRVIDLLNGAGAFDEWNGASLP